MTHSLLWLDLETTGLDVESCVIVEVGVVVTDLRLNQQAVASWLVDNGPVYRWEQGARDMARESGLLDSLDGGPFYRLCDIEAEIHGLLGTAETVTICGGGVGPFDMPLIRRWMPNLYARCTYWPLDASNVHRFLTVICGLEETFPFRPAKNHRALGDALGSLEQARQIRNTLRNITINTTTKGKSS